jgi:hypothetical protein
LDLPEHFMWWAHLASNQGPSGYEPVALPTELWALALFVNKRINIFNLKTDVNPEEKKYGFSLT